MKTTGAVIGGVVAFFVALLVVGLIGVYGFGWFQRTTADYRGGTAAIERTRGDGDYRIAQYDRFFNLCTSVQAQEDRIEILSGSDSPNATTDLAAVQSVRASLIREYNAASQATYTSGQFRSSGLPYQLSVEEEHTVCQL